MPTRARLLSFSACLLLAAPQLRADPAAAAPAPATPSPSAEAMLIDGLIYRPLYLASTVIGAGVFVVTLPFSAAGGNVGDAGERLVLDPARETFSRCLGCLPEDGY